MNYCKECGGNGICDHGKQRNYCIICNPKCACDTCKSVLVSKKSYGYPQCHRCYCITHPDEDIKRRYKLKENCITDYMKERYPSLDIVYDKSISGGCSLKRPDIFLDCFTHSVMCEIDENQHSGYSCENKRMMTLFEDLGSRPIIMIRFNPDSYIDSENSRVQSCFYHSGKKGYIPDPDEFERRVEVFCKEFEYCTNTIPTKEITIIHLFYNLFKSV